MTELIPTRRSQFIHSSRSTRRKEGGNSPGANLLQANAWGELLVLLGLCIRHRRLCLRQMANWLAFTCPWTAVRPSGPVRLRRSTAGVLPAGERGRRAGGTIELADSQRPLTLPRARAPLPRGGGVAMIPASFQATLEGVCVATILATLKGGFAFGEGLHS